VALVREGRLVGIMSLDNPGKATLFTSEQQQLARAIGQQAAIAIGNAQLYEQAQTERKRAEQLFERAQSIYQVTKAVNSGTELFSVLDIATREIISSLNADGGAIALMKENCLSIISSTQLHPSTKRIFTEPTLRDLSHCYSVATNEKSAFVTNKAVEKKEKRWYRRWGLRDFMVIPLLLGTTDSEKTVDEVKITPDTTHCIGFVFINYNRYDQYPSSGSFAFAQEIATLCALAIEKDRILAEAHQSEALATQRANTLDAVFDARADTR
jgi:GAF domain-containing protein